MDPRGAALAGNVLEAGRSSAGVDAASLLVGFEAPRPSSAASRPRTPFLAGLLGNARAERGETAPAPDPEAPQDAQPARAVGSETQSVVSDDSATQEALKKVRWQPRAARRPRAALETVRTRAGSAAGGTRSRASLPPPRRHAALPRAEAAMLRVRRARCRLASAAAR